MGLISPHGANSTMGLISPHGANLTMWLISPHGANSTMRRYNGRWDYYGAPTYWDYYGAPMLPCLPRSSAKS